MPDVDEVVPLPAHLEQCGCPGARFGQHLTSCVPAREFDAIPLQERPEYAEGRRFRAISWVFPLRISTTVAIDVQIDPGLYIAKHLDEYDAFEMERGYEEWEKPLVFLLEQINEECDMNLGGLGFGYGRHISHVSTTMDDPHESPRWTREAAAELDVYLASKRVDPNQETLDV